MTQMDINFCILLFYMFLRNVVALDKELVFYMGFSIYEFLKKLPSRKMSQWYPENFFWNFCLILYQNAYNFVQNTQILCFKSI